MTGRLSIGIAAAAGPELAARLASAVERAGLHTLWVNDTPGHDSLEVLAAAARVTERLTLATGVIPIDRRAPAEVLARVEQLALPVDRLVLGIGSGAGAAGALSRVSDAVKALGGSRRGDRPRVVVGALGPRMRRLGAEASDGLLLSWLTPDLARAQADEAHALSPAVHVALYVRAASDPAAAERLWIEAERYAGYPSYAANFTRLGIMARDTVIGPERFGDGIRRYRDTADEVVLRAIVADETPEDYERFVEAVADSIAAAA
ncbi:LLM class flavin-dependent oxidoreductase [Microbacterium sp. HD4P20]|uniref:LLM class flavin-dependent oxidoreductase n=1 Tax=Microbacterium sp. HD4P20 TaxID=2864874 RepID=UPI001C63CEFF|nr:LLM class flavin-dependent oxidoreductase [Microbacterium sp. HD4P20]MCP2637737.1 LLM class flavin-dependent oxidoreductase [Microbacterium sp. HD4P20]